MDITLKQLRAFVTVANLGQFTLAADKLGSSQSAVSTLVRQLETNLNLRLFDRHTRLLRLTQAGIDILPVASRAVADIEGMVESSRELNALRRGKVSIAAGTVQAALLLPPLINAFSKLYPEITVALHDVAEKAVLDYVANGTADLGVGTVPEEDTDLVGTRLTTDEFLVVLHCDDALVKLPELRWTDLAERKLIGPQRGNPIRDRLESELARNGIVLPLDKTMQEVALPLTIIGMVEAGLGVAIMTSAVVRLATSMGLIVRTPTEPLIRREVSLIQKQARSLSPAARRFRDFLLKAVH
ncbi:MULTISPECIES: LysR substrate-binding domain-containing protein [Ensifer]|uniref:LysR family transcriptional regulator n=1 Tax=Ensifer canadensis TaxID=555315 RepID=A0AAW4FIE8_9HYPH|nr:MULTISPECIES: LysR substrate-binding domain-containing protein [Ensifer]KQU90593.1 LysR family transcriptional regulator [Ensifer sp. Root31]KQW50369.1 LysR family transcriptional regulator [Ensifer sp. Root1252]KQW67341.1 LysR family transcriptional regulator [Ensifer sp. Root127]KRC74593.1 LysR family transcriptional regulator [Ensifer sp. Root231]KRC94679.1 LysR family transcriptional regulator [Ensifer sp. Root258]